jgi:SAM-dependent methyltransferase
LSSEATAASRLRFLAAAAAGRAIAVHPVARLIERWTALRAPKLAGPAPDGLPLPPAYLRVLVDGHGDPEEFVRRGGIAEAQVRTTVAQAGVELEELGAILDFGCGCGRTARRWAELRGPELHGCDYHSGQVAWCRENLPFMEFRTNPLEPPSLYPDDRFDLVYALSVLPHAERHMLGGRRTGARYDSGEAVVLGGGRFTGVTGTNSCAAFHPPSYVTERLLTAFEPVAFVPGGTEDHSQQDVHLVRLPPR